MRRLIALFVVGCGAAHAQSIGSVGIQDATVTGPLEVSNGRAVLVGNTTVTARDHTADIALSRGGALLVCSTSGLHVTAGKSTGGPLPLMLALDRGAIEVRMAATTSDIVITPDLRFTLRNDGTLDLRIRVTRNGDTCVENRGEAAPTLSIADQFGDGRYELRAGQHVLFEHGSLKEVVDHESSPCGCPPVPVVSVADAGSTSANPAAPGSTVAAKQAEEAHPFPAAASTGLAPGAEVPQAPPGVAHAQVAATLNFGAGSDTSPSSETARSSAGASETTPASTPSTQSAEPAAVAGVEAKAQTPPPPAPPPPSDVIHSIGRFFKKLFGRS